MDCCSPSPIVSLLLSVPNLRAALYPRRRPLILADHHESLSVLRRRHAPSSNSRDFSPPRRRSCRPSSRLECRPHLRLLEVLSCPLLILWRRPEGTGGAHVVTFDHRISSSLLTCTDSPPADALTLRRHSICRPAGSNCCSRLPQLLRPAQSPSAWPPCLVLLYRCPVLLSLSFTHHT